MTTGIGAPRATFFSTTTARIMRQKASRCQNATLSSGKPSGAASQGHPQNPAPAGAAVEPPRQLPRSRHSPELLSGCRSPPNPGCCDWALAVPYYHHVFPALLRGLPALWHDQMPALRHDWTRVRKPSQLRHHRHQGLSAAKDWCLGTGRYLAERPALWKAARSAPVRA